MYVFVRTCMNEDDVERTWGPRACEGNGEEGKRHVKLEEGERS